MLPNFALGRELQRAGNRCFLLDDDSRFNLGRFERRTRSLRLSVARPFRSRQP
jgi:hypothetical protein